MLRPSFRACAPTCVVDKHVSLPVICVCRPAKDGEPAGKKPQFKVKIFTVEDKAGQQCSKCGSGVIPCGSRCVEKWVDGYAHEECWYLVEPKDEQV